VRAVQRLEVVVVVVVVVARLRWEEKKVTEGEEGATRRVEVSSMGGILLAHY